MYILGFPSRSQANKDRHFEWNQEIVGQYLNLSFKRCKSCGQGGGIAWSKIPPNSEHFSRSLRRLEDNLTKSLRLWQTVLIRHLRHQRRGKSPRLLRLPEFRERGLAKVDWERTPCAWER